MRRRSAIIVHRRSDWLGMFGDDAQSWPTRPALSNWLSRRRDAKMERGAKAIGHEKPSRS
jgi:hypothetical protein